MHIKWTVHRYTTRTHTRDRYYSWTRLPGGVTREYREATLVRAVRVDGKPRQERIARIGSINLATLRAWLAADARGYGRYGLDPRVRFWLDADAVLSGSPEMARNDGQRAAAARVAALRLDDATRARLDAQLAKVVPHAPERD